MLTVIALFSLLISANAAGADACLGLYDKYYVTYIIDNGGDQSTPDEAAAATPDSSAKSPKTGDRTVLLIRLILAMMGVVIVSIRALRKNNH